MRSKFVVVSGIILAAVMIGLHITGYLTRYIHPRYIWFTLIMSAVGGLLLFVSLRSKATEPLKPSTWLVIACAAVALLFPARSLSPELASNRIQSSAASNQTTLTRSAVDNFSTDLTRFTIQDWDSFLKTQPTRDSVVGKQAQVEGFVFRSANQTFLARYMLSCCAVDATPLTIPLTNIQDAPDGTWLRISGTMVDSNSNDYPYQLKPTELQIIPEPKDPYVF